MIVSLSGRWVVGMYDQMISFISLYRLWLKLMTQKSSGLPIEAAGTSVGI